jgi:hypothetical protein
MKLSSVVLIFFFSIHSFGQIDASDLKKIEKILFGTELLKVHSSNANIDSTLFKGYYDGKQLPTNSTSKPDLIYISQKPVSLYEFEQFRKHVIDSVFRDRLYFCLEDDEEASFLLNFDDYFFNEEKLEMQDFDPSQRELNRGYFPLDYSRRVRYEDPSNKPCLAHFYVSRLGGFYRQKELNENLIKYRYYYFNQQLDESGKWKYKMMTDSSLIRYDLTPWAIESAHPNDLYSVLAQLYPKMFDFNVPATGLSIDQVKAFVIWKTEQLKRDFSAKGLDYDLDVKISAYSEFQHLDPCKAELPIPVKDNSSDWKISKEEYIHFWQEVKDSTLRECIYDRVLNDQHASVLIIHSDYEFDEGVFEYVNFDPSDRDVNRVFFPFDYSVKTRKYQKDVSCKACFDSLSIAKELSYTYFYRNCKETYPKTGLMKIVKSTVKIPDPNKLICKSIEESITHYLSYEQALAFYNWKYPIGKCNSSSKWTDYVFPSEAEFEKVKKGESVYLPFENIPFPSQLFSYTVRIYE